MPPFEPDWRTQDQKRITKNLYDLLGHMTTLMNEVIDSLRELPALAQ